MISADLSANGCAVVEQTLTKEDCRATVALYAQEERFRSHIIMARHGFGRGEYRYFRYPLPDLIQSRRQALYPRLAPIANDWSERMGVAGRYPDAHAEFLQQCRAAGQSRPTPLLLLQYGEGDYNCLHQDLYGDLALSRLRKWPEMLDGKASRAAAIKTAASPWVRGPPPVSRKARRALAAASQSRTERNNSTPP